MKADLAWLCGSEAAPGGYTTSTATMDLPGILVIAWEKLGVTFSSGLCACVATANSSEADASSAEQNLFFIREEESSGSGILR